MHAEGRWSSKRRLDATRWSSKRRHAIAPAGDAVTDGGGRREPLEGGGVQAPPTVLVVDDEPGIRDFLQQALTAAGVQVVSARDGIEALQAVADHAPAIVLTDLMMPRLDGYALIARLREARVPLRGIIAMSASSIVGSQPPPADVFIAKPFAIEHLVRSIVALLAHGEGPPA